MRSTEQTACDTTEFRMNPTRQILSPQIARVCMCGGDGGSRRAVSGTRARVRVQHKRQEEKTVGSLVLSACIVP